MPFTNKTFTGGLVITRADLNGVSDSLQYLKDALDLHGATSDHTLKALKSRLYGCRLTNSSDISVATATDKVLTWDQEDFDSMPAFHSTTTNTARITIPSGGDGTYWVGACVRFATDTIGNRQLWFEANGSAGTGVQFGRMTTDAVPSTQTYLQLDAFYTLAAGDYITCNVRHTSTTDPLSVGLSGGAGQAFWAARLSVG